MKFSSAITLGLISLATATPVFELDASEAETLEVEPWRTTTGLGKRDGTADNHFCGDKTWRTFGERAYLAGQRLIGRVDDHDMKLPQKARDEIPDQYFGKRGMCTNLWCGGDQKKGRAVVFWLCLHPETEDTYYNTKDLGKMFHDGFYDCHGREPQDDKDATTLAFHVWADGYDLHAEGGWDGMRCPEDMKATHFARPDSLNYEPYTSTPKPA